MGERRRTVRAVVRLEVYDDGRRQERIPLYISRNISGGGIFLITQEPYPPGTNIRISFTLPGDRTPVTALGEVVWSRDQREAPERQPGMGVKFVEIKDFDQERLRQFVKDRLDKGGD